MTRTPALSSESCFHELSPRARLAALLDETPLVELLGPFDRIHSPWLLQQGLVPQSDDGVVIVRGTADGRDVVGIAIESAFEGGSIGEVGGAKIATALQLAAESCRNGKPVAALLLLETGGVRLQEATLGLAAIAAIQSAIVALRELAPVIAVIAGPVGCFGGMSLAAELCTYIVGTPHGRLGMNGPEVIEQEAGADEIDASDRELIWQLVGCEARYRDGWIDSLVQDDPRALSLAVREGLAKGPGLPVRITMPARRLQRLRDDVEAANEPSRRAVSRLNRSRLWLECLSGVSAEETSTTPSVITAEVELAGERVLAIGIVPDPLSRFPRAAAGEVGLEQAWALAACVDQFIADERRAGTQRAILAIVDTCGQAYGRIEEQRCISAASAAAVDAYARARSAGHPVLTLVAGAAVSGAFLAHGLQSDHIFALADEQTSMYAMSAQSIARITRRTLAEVLVTAKTTLPMSFAIEDAHRLGIIDTLIEGIHVEEPTAGDLAIVRGFLAEALIEHRRGKAIRANISENEDRRATQTVQATMREQWSLPRSR